MGEEVDVKRQVGFTLVELIAIMVIVGVIAISMSSRMGSLSSSSVQSSRDDIVAALFFAQQTSMARGTIRLVTTATTVSVTENNVDIALTSEAYPLTLPTGVSVTPRVFVYDRLGRTTAGTITITNTSGASATITVETSGYVH